MIPFIVICIFFVIPGVSLIYFAVSLIRFLLARRKNKNIPGSISEEDMSARKSSLITSSVMFGACLLFVGGIFALLVSAVSNM